MEARLGLWGGARSSPVQNPHVFATGQGCSELVCLVYQSGIPELFPGKVPLLLTAEGNGVAVDSRAKVGVDPGVGESGAEDQWRPGSQELPVTGLGLGLVQGADEDRRGRNRGAGEQGSTHGLLSGLFIHFL